MLLLFEWGEYFLKSMSVLGDFLLYKPFAALDIYSDLSSLLPVGAQVSIAAGLEPFQDLSIAGIILGPSLVALLTFKIVKFILDIVF